jgi:hypothetical protein
MSNIPQFETSSHEAYGMAAAGIGDRHSFGIYPQSTGAIAVRLAPEAGVVSVSVAEDVSYSDDPVTHMMAQLANKLFGDQYARALDKGVPAMYAANTAIGSTREYMNVVHDSRRRSLRVSLAALCMGRTGEQVLVQAGHTRISGVQMSSIDEFKGLRCLTPEHPTVPFLAHGDTEPFTDELPATGRFRRFVLSTHDINVEHRSRLDVGNIPGDGLYRASRHMDPRVSASHLYVLAGGLINANNRGAIVVADVATR